MEFYTTLKKLLHKSTTECDYVTKLVTYFYVTHTGTLCTDINPENTKRDQFDRSIYSYHFNS